MRRALSATFLGLLVAFLCVPAASFGAPTYVGYVGCESTGEAPASHVCLLGQTPGAFFESPEVDAEYEVCVTFPEGETLCAEEQFVEAETLYVNEITTDTPGNHLVTWYVEGVEAASWTFRMDIPPEPEPAPVIPPVTTPPASTPPSTPPATPIIAPVTPEPTPSRTCLADKRTVKALEKKLKAAKTPKRRATLRKSLKRARSARRHAC